MKKHRHIFQPITIGTKRAKNRIEAAPAAPFLAGHDGSLTPEYYAYIRELAATGAGIVTLGVTSVDPAPRIGGRVLTIGSELFVSDFNEVAELIHSYDALACAEMVYSRYMLAPADIVVNETSTEEVEAMIACFIDGVARLSRTGFDMALIHGGHGNVPAMFFSQKHNRRTDRFGGSFKGRCRFALELLEGIRTCCGNNIALEYRISAEEILPGSTTFGETLLFAQAIQEHIDLLHVSRGLLEIDDLLPYINAPLYLPKAMNLPFAKRFKQELDIPVTVVGSFDLDLAEEAIASGDVDMVSMIRTLYADTRCVEKARLGKPEAIRPCIRCNTCIDRTHSHLLAVRCAVNPLLGRESRFDNRPSGDSARKIVIIGGGPAGLEAARTLSARGYRPILFEKEAELGGLFRMASTDEMKSELRAYLDWSVENVVNDPHIELRLGTEATVDTVRAESPDAVLLAIGAQPIIPSFTKRGAIPVVWIGDVEAETASRGTRASGIEAETANRKARAGGIEAGSTGSRTKADDVEARALHGEPGTGSIGGINRTHPCTEDLGNRVLIAGAGMTGMEFALSLTRQGKEVALVDLLPYEELGTGATTINLRCLKGLLEKSGVSFHCGCSVQGTDDSGMVIRDCDGAERILECDSVVISFGFKPDTALLEGFEEASPHSYRIGDCNGKVATLFNATQSAFDKAMQL